MFIVNKVRGFSLLEILVSLFVVSISAVNIAGLQKMLSDQNRDNTIHSSVQQLATEKMEEILQYSMVSELDQLAAEGEIQLTRLLTTFTLNWNVSRPVEQYQAGKNVRNVALKIEWQDSQGDWQSFIYNKQINVTQSLHIKEELASSEAAIIESFLETNHVIYFEPKMAYKAGSFVIYNSELFEATSERKAEHGVPRYIDNPASVAGGWKSHGLINNPELASHDNLATSYK